MKITQGNLEGINPVINRNRDSEAKSVTIDSYNEEKYNLILGEQRAFYCDETFDYIKINKDWQVALHIKDALEKRMSGIRALTLREFDTCARACIDLSSLVGIALMEENFGCAIIEGTPALVSDDGTIRDPWKLRNNFNKGLNWFKNKREKQSKEKQEAGDVVYRNTIERLKSMGLRLWGKELMKGIHIELTKPEFMTWYQYRESLQCKVKII